MLIGRAAGGEPARDFRRTQADGGSAQAFLQTEGLQATSLLLAEKCPDAILRQLSEHVNRALSGRFELFTERSVKYYRRLVLEQKASGGELKILFQDGKPVCAVQSAREAYPPMMCRVMNREAFEKRLKTDQDQPFSSAYVCEVV